MTAPLPPRKTEGMVELPALDARLHRGFAGLSVF
jgi:hypothetical protein